MLALHESAVVRWRPGYALGPGEPSLALLHTTAGLGNAVGAIATCRANRTPVVILVGQQDRRHIAFQPFLAGRLEGLAATIRCGSTSRCAAVGAGAIERAYHEAETQRGPALVIVPMGDWAEAAGEQHETAAPERVLRPPACDDASVAALAR